MIIKNKRNKILKTRKSEAAIESSDCSKRSHKCQWCGTLLPESEMHEENDVGLRCKKRIMAIRSRGEPLTFKNRDKK